MKTEYLVLWVDDEVDNEDVVEIREYLDSHGVYPDIRLIEPQESQDMHELVGSVVNDPNLDLIIVDNKMFGDEGGWDGNQLIQAIRESDHVYLPVIFYSSGGIDPLMAAVQEQKLDGVYLTPRDFLADKAKTVIKSLLKKEQTIKRTRGLLMEGVSEIDAKFGEMFKELWNRLSDEQKTVLENYFRSKMEERCESVRKQAEDFPNSREAFEAEMSENFVSAQYDTYMRWKVLKKGLKALGVDKPLRRAFDDLFDRQDKVVPLATLRNQYGHRTRMQLETDHSEEKCISIRRELRRQYTNLDNITHALK